MARIYILCVLAFLIAGVIAEELLQRVKRASRPKCPQFSKFNGKVKYRRRGTRAVFRCSKGFTRYGNRAVNCRADNTWSGEAPVCIKANCVPMDIRHIDKLDMKEMYGGALLSFVCEDEYQLIGATEIHCDGKVWSADLPACQAPTQLLKCGFETDLCGWSQDDTDDLDWVRHQGHTSTGGTGPNTDHTLQTVSGHYMFVESSSPAKVGDQARLLSPEYPADMGDRCFEFWYHMLGPDDTGHVGTLEVYILGESQFIDDLQPVFVKDGNQGNVWRRGEIYIDKTDEPYQIVIATTRKLSYISDIAIDDVRLYNCSGTPSPPNTSESSSLISSTLIHSLSTDTTPERSSKSPTYTVASASNLTPGQSTSQVSTSTPVSASAPKVQTSFTTSLSLSSSSSVTSSAAADQTSLATSTLLSSLSFSSSVASTETRAFSSLLPGSTYSSSPVTTTRTFSQSTEETSSTESTSPTTAFTTTTEYQKLSSPTTTTSTISTTKIPATTSSTSSVSSTTSSTSPSIKTSEMTTIRKSPSTKILSTVRTPSVTVVTTTTTKPSTSRTTVVETPPPTKSTTKSSSTQTISVTSTSSASTTSRPLSSKISTTAVRKRTTSTSTESTTTQETTTTPPSTLKLSTTTVMPTTKRRRKTTAATITTSKTTTTTTKRRRKTTAATITTSKTTTTPKTSSINPDTSKTTKETTMTFKSTERTNPTTATTKAKSTKAILKTTAPSKTSQTVSSTVVSKGIPEVTSTMHLKTSDRNKTNIKVSIGEHRSKHPDDETLKPLMIGLGVGIFCGLIVIGVIAWVCVRRRKFYTSRYEDELKPITKSSSNDNFTGVQYEYHDDEYEH